MWWELRNNDRLGILNYCTNVPELSSVVLYSCDFDKKYVNKFRTILVFVPLIKDLTSLGKRCAFAQRNGLIEYNILVHNDRRFISIEENKHEDQNTDYTDRKW